MSDPPQTTDIGAAKSGSRKTCMSDAWFKVITLSAPSFDGSFELASGQTSMTETAGALYFWLGEQADQIGFPAPQQVLAPCDMHAGYTYSLLIGQDGKAQVVDVRKAASATFGECGR